MLAKGVTAEEFRAREWPAKVQLVDGAVVVDAPGEVHQVVAARVFARLVVFTGSAPGRGVAGLPMAVTVNPANVFAPDVWWVDEHRRPTLDQLSLDGLPDLVVEIRSPSTWIRDLRVKLPRYEAAGVPEAWYVDTEARMVFVFRRSRADVPTFDVSLEVGVDQDLTSPLLEGFSLRVGAIFA